MTDTIVYFLIERTWIGDLIPKMRWFATPASDAVVNGRFKETQTELLEFSTLNPQRDMERLMEIERSKPNCQSRVKRITSGEYKLIRRQLEEIKGVE